MPARLACTALLVVAALLPAVPATAQTAAESYVYREKRFRHACRPPFKFAAGACVRRCPAGYRNMGGYCRLQSGQF